jgi:hypothetical protein
MLARCGAPGLTQAGTLRFADSGGGFMVARSIGSGTISFGLVSIPVRLYVATRSEQLSFNMLH